LVVLVALVGGFVVWDHYKGTPTQKAESKRRRILDLDPNDITGIGVYLVLATALLEYLK